MPFSRNQKGFIHLGLIAVFVLAAGLFAASKLASNPDLTFFNVAEEAKIVGEGECAGCKGIYEFRWDKKSLSCKKKVSTVCKKKDQETNLTGRAAGKGIKEVVKSCGSGLHCHAGDIPGSFKCRSGEGVTDCCPKGQKDLGNGRCESFDECGWKYCSLEKYSGSNSVCVDSEGRNRYCCSGGNPDDRIKACSRLLSNGVKLPVCGDSGCSANKVWDSQIRCVSTEKPEGQYCCPAGTKLWASGKCQ